VSRDDVVPQRPEDLRLLLRVFHTPTACPGAVSAYLLRRIAYRAGAYAPGIQESLFHELTTSRDGGTIEKVESWFQARLGSLHDLGYRMQCWRVATPTQAILDWVASGRGYRGAVLLTNFTRLHPGDPAVPHAVGVTVDRLEAKGDEQLVMIDPWPGTAGVDRTAVPPALGLAQRDRNFQGLALFWSGWS
jgi:hypothetical protein